MAGQARDSDANTSGRRGCRELTNSNERRTAKSYCITASHSAGRWSGDASAGPSAPSSSSSPNDHDGAEIIGSGRPATHLAAIFCPSSQVVAVCAKQTRHSPNSMGTHFRATRKAADDDDDDDEHLGGRSSRTAIRRTGAMIRLILERRKTMS